MQLVDKINSILELLSGGEPMSVSEIAEAVDLPMPSVYRLVTAMTEKGMLEKDLKTKRYSPGWALVQYAKNVRETSERKHRLRQVMPYMQQVLAETGETVTLAALTGTRVVLVAVLDGKHSLRFYSELGKEMPWNAAAPAKLFLAWMGAKEREKIIKKIQYTPYTARTIVTEEALRAELEKVGQEGFAFCVNELDPYCCAVSVPIFDEDGNVALALTTVGQVDRMNQHMDQIQDCLRAAATNAGRAISER